MRTRNHVCAFGHGAIASLVILQAAPLAAESGAPTLGVGGGKALPAGPMADGTPLAVVVQHFLASQILTAPLSAASSASSGKTPERSALVEQGDRPAAAMAPVAAAPTQIPTSTSAPNSTSAPTSTLAPTPAPIIEAAPAALPAPSIDFLADAAPHKPLAKPNAKPQLAKNRLALAVPAKGKGKKGKAALAQSPSPAATSPDEPPAGAMESLRDAIVASLKSNPEIQITLAQQDDARYAVAEARAAYLPHLDVTLGYGREFAKAAHQPGTTRNRLEATATLSQNLWDFGITINDIKRAKASYRSAQWATREKIEAISYDITNAYLGVLQQQKLVDLGLEEIETAKHILHLVTVQKDLGLTTSADVSRAQSRVENVQSTLLDRKSALQQARNAYRRLTNHLPAKVLDLPASEAVLPAGADEAVDMIDTRSPRMAQAVEDRRSLDKQYDSQTGTFFPRIGLMVQGNHKYDVTGATGLANDGRAMVTVTYNLFNGGADRALRNRIGARIREADYELDRRRREVEQDIRSDFDGLKAARQKIATINAEIASAQKVVDLYREQFREGKRTVFDLLDSETQLYGARANFIANATAMHAAEYRVLQKLGGLFDLVSDGEPLPKLQMPAGYGG